MYMNNMNCDYPQNRGSKLALMPCVLLIRFMSKLVFFCHALEECFGPMLYLLKVTWRCFIVFIRLGVGVLVACISCCDIPFVFCLVAPCSLCQFHRGIRLYPLPG